MSVLKVALDVPLPQLFDYLEADGGDADTGDRVVVPFGSRAMVGVVVERVQSSDLPRARLKKIAALRRDAPRLPREWLDLMRFLSGYYQRPLGETVISSLPPRLRSLKPLPADPLPWYRLVPGAPGPDTQRPGAKRALLAALASGAAQPEALLVAAAGSSAAAGRAALRRLIEKGLVERAPVPSGARFAPEHPTSAAQSAALGRILESLGDFSAFLLYGVTGSGKTEVYMHLAARVLESGGQALVLVPEIGLTPQLEARFRAAFPDTFIAVMHSGLDESTRTAAWLAAARGEAGIVLGTRLAALAPLPRLALVVIDEEHDTSYKQHEGLRYSGRDAAVMRAKLAGCPVVLGSATPALETWYKAQGGRYVRIDIPERATAGSQLPAVRLLDLNAEPAADGLAPGLVRALAACLERREQSLVFINRRGYAPVLACPACDWNAGCSRCTARLVLHAAERLMRCHYCGEEAAIPRTCPTCGNLDLHPLGRGTQRVEETLAQRFPSARILRIDRDSTRRRGALARSFADIHRGEADILVGTQLLAKGHDFPQLTLVGVLNADSALVSTDYRAPERLFSTLVQVAGRAGRRAAPGQVLIQTRYPRHPLYVSLARHDYTGFAATQLEERRIAGFPPFVYEAALRAEARGLDTVLGFLRAARAAGASGADGGEIQLYDPVPHVVTRRADVDRAQLLVQSASRGALQKFLAGWGEPLRALAPRGLRWHIDVDPIEFD